MAYSEFFKEIYSDNLSVDEQGIHSHLPFIKKHLSGAIIDFPERDKLVARVYDRKMGFFDFFEEGKSGEEIEEGVLVIPIKGLLTKFGDWWDYGTEELAEILTEAYKNDSIKSIVLNIHSGGGTTHAVIPMVAAIKRRNKPVLAAINSRCMSCAKYIAVFCDKVIAVDTMAETGSIGVMTELVDDTKYLESIGIIVRSIYPPESNWKNRSVEEALKGNDKWIIAEELSPWARHFQEIVRSNRPKLDESVEGILNGRTFYAGDALKYGLVDAIMPMDEIIQYAFDYTQKAVNQFINT